jgi:competence protein ComEA
MAIVLLVSGGLAAPLAQAFTFNGKSSEQLGNSQADTPAPRPAAEPAAAPKRHSGSLTINGKEVGGKAAKPSKPQTKQADTNNAPPRQGNSASKAQASGGWLAGLFGGNSNKQRSNGGVLMGKLNVNTASARELAQVKGIGPSKAAAIVAYRRTHGNFSSLADLEKVKGIGPSTLAKVRPQLKAN